MCLGTMIKGRDVEREVRSRLLPAQRHVNTRPQMNTALRRKRRTENGQRLLVHREGLECADPEGRNEVGWRRYDGELYSAKGTW